MKIKVLLTISFVFLILAYANSAERKIFNVKKYGAAGDGKTNDSPAFKKAVLAAIESKEPAMVFIPDGEYLLKEPMMPGADGMIDISNANDLILEGGKNTLLVSTMPNNTIIRILNSKNVIVRNLQLDRKPLAFTQGIIDKIDMENKTVDLSIDKGYDEPDAPLLKDQKRFLVRIDPNVDSYDFSRPEWWPLVEKRERIAPMKWRFTLNISPLLKYLKKPFFIWDYSYSGAGVIVRYSKDCLVDNVKYYGGGAQMGFGYWNNTGTITFRRFFVGIPKGSNRLISAAGGSQGFNNHATIVIEDCEFQRVDDDCVNQGTSYLHVEKQITPNTVEVEERDVPFYKGDTLSIWDWMEKKEKQQAVIVDSKNTGNTTVLTLDRELKNMKPRNGIMPPKMSWDSTMRYNESDGFDRAINLNASGQAIIRNCKFSSMRARGVLLKTSNSIIENCTFKGIHMRGIIAGPELWWGEGPQVRNLVIRNNTFDSIDGCNIDVVTFRSDNVLSGSMDNKNILIENNTFINVGNRGGVGLDDTQGICIRIRNAQGVIVRKNKIVNFSKTLQNKEQPALVEGCSNVKIKDNEGIPDFVVE